PRRAGSAPGRELRLRRVPVLHAWDDSRGRESGAVSGPRAANSEAGRGVCRTRTQRPVPVRPGAGEARPGEGRSYHASVSWRGGVDAAPFHAPGARRGARGGWVPRTGDRTDERRPGRAVGSAVVPVGSAGVWVSDRGDLSWASPRGARARAGW